VYVSQHFSTRNEIHLDGIPKRAITQGGSNRSTSAAIRTAPLEFAFARIRIILRIATCVPWRNTY